MSDFRAVATVTATLQHVMQAAVQTDVPGATVTAVRPGEGASANLPVLGINLFLYQLSHRGHRANDDLPTRRGEGSAVQQPVAPVELHYLLSCYGDDLQLEPQRLLGSAIAFLNAQPQLTRAQIQAVVDDPANTFLAGSDLPGQIDLVRFSPMNLTLDELSRLWSVFLQTHYVLSTTFKAATVLLDRPIRTVIALPVRDVRVGATVLRHPRIARITPATAGAAITPGAAIALEGLELDGDTVEVWIDRAMVPTTSVEATRIVLTLPAGLAAGPHSAMVRLGIDMGPPGGARLAFASDLAAFVLQPIVTKNGAQFNVTVSQAQGAGAASRSARIAIGVDPPVGERQMATLEMLGAQGVAYTFAAPARTAPASQLVFAVSGVAAGDYVVRVRVDGAATPLDLDANQAPVAPKVTIP
jgi:hypothetical protein